MNEVVPLLASLGGFLGIKGDGEPGVTIWQGIQRVAPFAAGMKFARSMDNKSCFVCKDMGSHIASHIL